jgi:hypothetical protein
MTRLQIKLATNNGTLDELIEQEAVKRIRMRYTINKELSIHRKKDESPEKYAEMCKYIKACVNDVKSEILKLGGVLDE